MNPDIYARMLALCDLMSADVNWSGVRSMVNEAREIMALVNSPVDPDLIEAKEIVEEMTEHSVAWTDQRVSLCLIAIRHGRELAKAEQSEAIGLLQQADTAMYGGGYHSLREAIRAFIARHHKEITDAE